MKGPFENLDSYGHTERYGFILARTVESYTAVKG
jgi:hypothetical protein